MISPAASGPGGRARAPDEQQFQRSLIQAVLWPAGAMLVLAAVFLGLIVLLLDSARWVEHTDQVIAQTHLVERLLVDRETGLRGYLLTGNPDFLEPYSAANTALPARTEALAALIADNPVQLERLAAIAEQREPWEAFAQEALARFEGGGDYQSFVAAGIGKARMDEMRDLLDRMVTTEEALREERVAATERVTVIVAGGSITLAAVLGALLAWFTRRQLLRLAEQYGSALEATARSATRLQALHQIDRAILTRTPLAKIVAGALQRLAPLVGAARAVAILDPPAHPGQVRVIVDPDQAASQPQPLAWEPDVVADLFGPHPAEPRVLALEQLERVPPVAQPLHAAQATTALASPLQSNGDTCGMLAFGVPSGALFPSDVVPLLQEVADQLTIALQQERLRQEVARHTAELERRVEARTAALEAANVELEAFGYSVAHDLRAPVRAMQSFAAALREDYDEQLDALGQEYAQRIVSAGERMEELINDLLAYSRLSRVELSFGRVPLGQALDDALAQLTETIAARAADIHIERPLPVVVGHRTTLAQILANLLTNAMTFVAPGATPQITVSTTVMNDWARLAVRDNGIGIAPEHQERIFRVFERLHGVEQYPGTGIGLAIVRKGVERMGGRFGVESQPGQGSTFWIELPTTENRT